jgi:SH3-like domain-containing protein
MPDLRRRHGAGVTRSRPVRAAAAAATVLLAIALSHGTAWAAPDEDTGLKIPRFVSLQADKINLRTGPGRKYPIEWVLTRKDMPVEIIQQFEHWRRIREWDGTVGWVQQHMVTGKRYVIVTGAVRTLYSDPDVKSDVVARAEPGVIAHLAECRGAWCRIDANDVSGWVRRSDVWGVYPDETVP